MRVHMWVKAASIWSGAWEARRECYPCLARSAASLVLFSSCLFSTTCLSRVELCSRRAGAELRGWVEKGFCRANRGHRSPFAVTLLLQSHRALLSAQPGAVVQLQRLQQMERLPRRWRHCYKFPVPSELDATQGTSPSGAPGPAFCCLHSETWLLGLWVLQPGLENTCSTRGHLSLCPPNPDRCCEVRSPRPVVGSGFPKGCPSFKEPREQSQASPHHHLILYILSSLSRCEDRAFVSFPHAQKKGRRI